MDASKKGSTKPKRPRPIARKVDSKARPPARTVEGRENQLIEAAVNLAEKQLSDGTASAQVITHYLKLGTTRERLEKEKLANENELLIARKEALQSAKHIEDLYADAIVAMRKYSGTREEDNANDVED